MDRVCIEGGRYYYYDSEKGGIFVSAVRLYDNRFPG